MKLCHVKLLKLIEIKVFTGSHGHLVGFGFVFITTQMQSTMKQNPFKLPVERFAQYGSIVFDPIYRHVYFAFNAFVFARREIESDDVGISIVV